jgi:hypothetical protein
MYTGGNQVPGPFSFPLLALGRYQKKIHFWIHIFDELPRTLGVRLRKVHLVDRRLPSSARSSHIPPHSNILTYGVAVHVHVVLLLCHKAPTAQRARRIYDVFNRVVLPQVTQDTQGARKRVCNAINVIIF